MYGLGRGLGLAAQPDLPVLDALLARGPWPWLSALGGALAAAVSLALVPGPDLRERLRRLRRVLLALLAAAAAVVLLLFASPQARLLVPLVLAGCAALPLAGPLARLDGPSARVDRALAGGAFLAAASVYVVFSVTRHVNFGSGSWDLGCYAQSAWLAGHFRPLVSSLLRDAHVLGDHFVPVVYLLGPVFWVWPDAAALLWVQAVLVASAALPLFWLARREGLGRPFALAIALSFLFALGTQSAIEFDFHHIALGAGFFAWAYWFLETGRPRLALPWLLLLFLCKEGASLYVAFLGLYAALFQGHRRFGAATLVAGCAAFFLVVGWVMPHFAGSPEGIRHLLRYEHFGPSLGPALLGALAHPLRTLSIAMTPAVKVESLLLVLAGFAFLPALSPRHLLLALPMLAERFLSTKQEMWGTGFHYGLMLTLVAALAAVRGAGRARPWLEALWERLTGSGPRPAAASAFLAAACLASTWLVDGWGAGAPADFASLEKPYFSRQVAENRRALAAIPPDAPVAAQDHFLPHLALREKVWLLEEARRAEYVVANPADGAWPYRREDVVQLLRALLSEGYRPVFSEETALVLRRDAPDPVPLSPRLGQMLE